MEENTEEVASIGIYVDRVFDDEEEAYDAYNSYAMGEGFCKCKNKTRKVYNRSKSNTKTVHL